MKEGAGAWVVGHGEMDMYEVGVSLMHVDATWSGADMSFSCIKTVEISRSPDCLHKVAAQLS